MVYVSQTADKKLQHEKEYVFGFFAHNSYSILLAFKII